MNRQALDRAAQAQLFTAARTVNQWQDRAVDEKTLHELYELAKWAPTSMNSAPARLVFVVGAEAKARLQPALGGGNVERMMNAPATIIVASDPHFYEHLPELFPAYPTARDMYAENLPWASETAFRNSSMQGAYLILAARALGLDCGPMSGFDNAKVDEAFFFGRAVRRQRLSE